MKPKFNYQKVCSDLLKDLPQRTSQILERRFGLKGGERQTLEAIGQDFGLTRERVRQIVREGISEIQPKIKKQEKIFKHFDKTLKNFGDLKKEDALLSFLGGENNQNRVFFLLTLNNDFERFAEDDSFYSFWARNPKAVQDVKKTVSLVLNKFQEDKTPISLIELYNRQKGEIRASLAADIGKNVFSSYIETSKEIQKNPEDKYGLKNWLEINPKGIKDKAYLVLRKEGKPMHFTQVAAYIEKLPFLAKRRIHLATVHNELIKDSRFVLVGRGLYALKEWGYEPGVVKDIILKVLREAPSPLSKEEIIKRVSEQRMIKTNTIILNLQDSSAFLRDDSGKYKIREA